MKKTITTELIKEITRLAEVVEVTTIMDLREESFKASLIILAKLLDELSLKEIVALGKAGLGSEVFLHVGNVGVRDSLSNLMYDYALEIMNDDEVELRGNN